MNDVILVEIRDLLREALVALQQIAANQDAAKTLEARREKHAEVMRRKRAKKRDVTMRCDVTEKEQERKRDIPPTPPIERKREEEKEHTHTSRARARISSDIPSVEEVAEECRRIGSDIDPQYFVDFYDAAKGGWPKDWKAKLRNWTANTIESGRVKTPPEEKRVESQKELCDRLLREVLEERAKRHADK